MLIQLSTARFLASEAMRPCVLVVDDETIICELLVLVLEGDYQVICASTSNDALRVLAEQNIDVMLLDYHLPSGGAVEVARRADEIGIPMAWMTGDHAVEFDSHRVLLKPFHIDRVSETLAEIRGSARLVIKPPGHADGNAMSVTWDEDLLGCVRERAAAGRSMRQAAADLHVPLTSLARSASHHKIKFQGSRVIPPSERPMAGARQELAHQIRLALSEALSRLGPDDAASAREVSG